MKLRWNRPRGLLFTLLFLGVAASPLAIAGSARSENRQNSQELELQTWPAQIWSRLEDAANRLGTGATNALFDCFESFDLFSVKLEEQSRLGFHVEREVYDNFDAFGTWTVIDRARVRAQGAPLSEWSTLPEGASTPSLGMPYASFVFEPQATIEWANVRQVQARQFQRRALLKKLREERDQIRQAGLAGSPLAAKAPEPDPNVNEFNPYTPWYYADPSVRARFSKIGNLLAFPLRTPLSVRTFREKMKDGEVISWAANGHVEVGASIGWKIIPDPTLLSAGIDFRVTAVAEGGVRISVLRENERFAKVKLSTHERHGSSERLTVGAKRRHAFEGFLLFRGTRIEKTHVLSQNLKVVPIDIENRSLRGGLFDIGYRYDLGSSDGQDAYHRAVLGSFAASEEIALRDAKSDTPAVQKIFERKGETDDRELRKRGQIAFFLKHDQLKKLNTIEAQIELPDGSHHIFSSVADRQNRLRTWFGATDEKTSRKISVLLDQELFDKNDPNSLFIIGESFYEDSDTSGKELARNISEIENFFDRPELFPEISYSVPRKNSDPEHRRMRKAWFGRSSFYWGFHAKRPEIERFLETSVENRSAWVTALLPSNKRASVLRDWNAATTAYRRGDAQETFRSLKSLFDDRSIGRPLMLLLRTAIDQPLSYFITATNASFGRIQESGKSQTSVDKILTLTDQEMGFEGYAKRQQSDPDASVSEVTAEETPDGLIRVSFSLSEEAKTVYFRLSRPRDFWGARDITELAYSNRADPRIPGSQPLFHKGLNTLVLDPLTDSDLVYRLVSGIRRDENYLLQISFSRDVKHFGSLAGAGFKAGLGYPRARQNSKQVSKTSTDSDLQTFVKTQQ